MKKLFGGLNLTWPKLIIFSIIAAVYTALIAIIPIFRYTSFETIVATFEVWIFFGIFIIMNSKSPKDSALKCFIFFLISQPLVYLIQVPFSSMGWGLFGYYRYWFYWTLACLPMGFIGYYIKKKNYLSVLILSPMIIFLVLLGFGYFSEAIANFPHHLLSGIYCYLFIVIIVLGIFDKKKLRLISFGIAILATIAIIILKGGIGGSKFETYRNIDNLNINLVGKMEIIEFTAYNKTGEVKIVDNDRDIHTFILSGWKNGRYEFTIEDEEHNQYNFEYYYDEKQETVLLNIK